MYAVKHTVKFFHGDSEKVVETFSTKKAARQYLRARRQQYADIVRMKWYGDNQISYKSDEGWEIGFRIDRA